MLNTGNTQRSAAARFDLSVKFVNEMVRLKHDAGALVPECQGNPGISKLTLHEDWVRVQVDGKGKITRDELAARLVREHGVIVDPCMV